MLLKKHHIIIWLRIIGILVTCLVIAFVTVIVPDWLYLINLIIILFIQVLFLVRSQNKINRELEQLFDTLDCSDTTASFLIKKKNTQFKKLYKEFDRILEQVQKLKVDSLQKNVYLTTLFEHINIGILSLTEDGSVHMKNSSAKRILGGNLNSIKDIHLIDAALANTIETIKPDESKLVSIYRDGYLQHLSFRAAFLKFSNEEIKIVTFQNIRGELDVREMESWQKLIRVLTHELMNSAGPINSTISTIMELLTENNQTPKNVHYVSAEILNDTIKGLKIIEERSKGMVDFVKRFRSLTLIPHPVLSNIDVDELIGNIILLMSEEAEKNGVKIQYKTNYSNLKIMADKGMIEQIMINLLKNSLEAVKTKSSPVVNILSWSDKNSNVYIDIANNGKVIPQEIQDKIFVPFFTTRKNGTGIGLSLSRQLANVQGGALVLTKSTEQETVFTLKL